MITLFGRVDLEPARVRAIFVDTDNWPHWMPGIASVRTLAEGEEGKRLAVTQRVRGHRFEQDLDCRFSADQLRFVQRSGTMRKWDSTWRFAPPPAGQGSTLSCRVDVELGGLLGLLTPGRALNALLEELFRETLRRLEARGRLLDAGSATAAAPGEGVIFQVYRTDRGLEVWIDGRRYRLKHRDQ